MAALTGVQVGQYAAKHFETSDVINVSRQLAIDCGVPAAKYDELVAADTGGPHQPGYGPRFTPSVVDIAVDIAWHESRWDPNQHNPVPPDDSYGLWQINMRGDLGPDRRRALDIESDAELYDPDKNAEAARYVYDENGHSFAGTAGWSSSYKKAIKGYVLGERPTGAPTSTVTGNASEGGLYPGQLQVEGAVGNVVGGVVDGLAAIGGFFAKLAGYLFSGAWWARIGVAVLGALLVGLAVWLATK